MSIIRSVLLSACLLCSLTLSAQRADKVLTNAIDGYFKNYDGSDFVLKNCRLERKRNNIVINKPARRITIYANKNFAVQVFTPERVQKIYSDIRKLLPKEFRRYKIEVIAHRKPIEQLIPNIYRDKKEYDYGRMTNDIVYTGEPWVKNTSRPYTIDKGLQGRHLALWQSHGRVYANDKGMWQWQRPALYCTTEDLFTQSIAVQFLIPMLENAGALMYTPRERDWQPRSVIVDNDVTFGASQYLEGKKDKGQWNVAPTGFMLRDGFFVDHENPFANGISRYIATSGDAKNVTALAKWQPEILEDGEYAVYVTYQTLQDAIPDARYSVLHAGGVTEFCVNQQMGGGVWVYLGTFRFKKGAHENQGVQLSNASSRKGVVSADAVRFGGGTGVVMRGDTTLVASGMPRYLEGARYALQWGGFPYEVYSPSNGERDYTDDINCRSHALNYLTGGSVYNPDTVGLSVPLEMSFGFHSDAGYNADDALVGSLGIVTTDYNGDTLATGKCRYLSRDIIGTVLESVKRDIDKRYGINWAVRGIIDKSYSESRLPVVPSMIFESMSHQNFSDMSMGHDPDFKFTVARAVYKALLKQLTFVQEREYVVQPLPVSSFAVTFHDEKNVLLSWQPTDDELEPTAVAQKYILYTRVGDGGFDNGRIIESTSCLFPIIENVQYSFKVAALNDGGESFPSEVLTAYKAAEEKGRVMIINGFHRLSGPKEVNTPAKAGFDMDADPGVAYIRTPEYCGRQLDYQRVNIGYEDGLGLSGNDFEGMLIAGNSFDYPYLHGKALASNGISFVSCSSEALSHGSLTLAGYNAVDLILGVEKQGEDGSYLGYNKPYKTFPKDLQRVISEYCASGGRLFVSGAHIASDMIKNDADRDFIRNTLKFDYGGSISNIYENRIFGSNLTMDIYRSVNEECYAVARPDILVPMNDAFVSFVFDGCKESAGVAYAGTYRVLSASFPFESIVSEEQRSMLMGAIMRFLLN